MVPGDGLSSNEYSQVFRSSLCSDNDILQDYYVCHHLFLRFVLSVPLVNQIFYTLPR
jgi:hypothetical protein